MTFPVTIEDALSHSNKKPFTNEIEINDDL